MKLAFCIFKYFPHGGLSRNFIRIIHACQQLGHSIQIYTMEWEGASPQNCQMTIIRTKGFTNHQRCASYVKILQKTLKQKHFDVIVGFNRMPGLDIFYAADVCYEHDIRQRHGFIYRLMPRYRIYSTFERAVFGPTSKTKIMLISETEKHYFIEHYNTPDDRFYLLPPGIAKDRIAPANADEIRKATRKAHLIHSDQKLLLLIGSNFELKGVDRAIKAIASLPEPMQHNIFLWIIGQGRSGYYKRLAKRLSLENHVKFLGTRNDIPQLLLGADLLIHPARREAAGMVLLEAVVAGLPVLTTDVCGFAFHIELAKAGLVTPSPFDQKTLNEALLFMLTSKQYEEWRKNALKYAHSEDLYNRAKKVAEIIEANKWGQV